MLYLPQFRNDVRARNGVYPAQPRWIPGGSRLPAADCRRRRDESMTSATRTTRATACRRILSLELKAQRRPLAGISRGVIESEFPAKRPDAHGAERSVRRRARRGKVEIVPGLVARRSVDDVLVSELPVRGVEDLSLPVEAQTVILHVPEERHGERAGLDVVVSRVQPLSGTRNARRTNYS